MISDDESMRYGMIDTDPLSPLQKLEKYLGEIDWPQIRPHFENGSLIWVDPTLSLVEVGDAFARDDLDLVRSWRQLGDIVIPGQAHADHWESTRERFLALVVSPFVLIQPRAVADSHDDSTRTPAL